MRIDEINERLAAIEGELEGATGEALTALESEVNALTEERKAIEAETAKKQELRSAVAAGTVGVKKDGPKEDAEARAASEFARTGRLSIGTEQARATLISGGTLATPTAVHGIYDLKQAHYSSIIDLVRVVDCQGMGSNKVAYISADNSAAASQTEGSAGTAGEATFAYVTITPTSYAVISQISKQVRKQTPLAYKAKVTEQALISLRKRAAAVVTGALAATTLVTAVDATVSGGVGVVDDKTLRNLVLALGGNDGVGPGVLFLSKTDLIAFGDVRGTNEKKAVYKITPDSENPNTGIIEDAGLAVKYCLVSGLTACAGTAQAALGGDPKKTMFYGDPKAIELDLFSPYEVSVSEDFAFTSLMDTIRGDMEIGCDVVQAGAFVVLSIPAALS